MLRVGEVHVLVIRQKCLADLISTQATVNTVAKEAFAFVSCSCAHALAIYSGPFLPQTKLVIHDTTPPPPPIHDTPQTTTEIAASFSTAYFRNN